MEGTNVFSLEAPNRSYTLTKGESELPGDSFRLLPKHRYVITNHTYGDATDSDITVITDDSGRIVQASPEVCK